MTKTILYLCVGCLLLGGCRRQEVYPVQGTITFNGEAISNGEIQLLPADEKSAPAAGRIENGQYRLLAKPGPKRVSIRAARRMERNVPNSLGADFQDYIPAEFNSQSTLRAEVTPSDDNHLDFDLKTEPPP